MGHDSMKLMFADSAAEQATLLCRPAVDGTGDYEWGYQLYKRADQESIEFASSKPWSEPDQRSYYTQQFKECRPQILIWNGRDVGFFSLEEMPHGLKLRQLHIDPDAQGQGIGAAVLAHCLEQAHHLKKALELHVLVLNLRGKAFYERHGYEMNVMSMTNVGWSAVMRHKDTVQYLASLDDDAQKALKAVSPFGMDDIPIMY